MGTKTFDVDGHQVGLALEADGWLVAKTPLMGTGETLLDQQQEMRCLAKVAAGPSLRAELSVDGSVESAGVALQGAMQAGLAVLDGRDTTAAPMAHADQRVSEVLGTYAPAAYVLDWAKDGTGWRCRVETSRGVQRVAAWIEPGAVSLAADLVRLRDPEPLCLRALAHFLLALNRRLRLARGSLDRRAVRLEVVLPADILDPRLLDQALGALAVGVTHARRECAALLEPALATHYCALHLEGALQHTTHHTGRTVA